MSLNHKLRNPALILLGSIAFTAVGSMLLIELFGGLNSVPLWASAVWILAIIWLNSYAGSYWFKAVSGGK